MAKFVGGRDSGLLRAVEGLSELRLKENIRVSLSTER